MKHPHMQKTTVQQARKNVCLVLSITFMATIFLAMLILVGILFWFTRTDHSSGMSPPIPQPVSIAPTNGNPISSENIAQLQATRHIMHGNVGVVTCSTDGLWLAIAEGHDIMLYNPLSKSVVATFKGHRHDVNALAFSPVVEGKTTLLASTAVDEPSIFVWDVNTGKKIWQLEGHQGWIRDVAFSPDGNILASTGTDKSVRLWDMLRGRLMYTLQGHTTTVSGVAFRPDGKTLASTSRDGSVRLWDVHSGEPLHPIPFFETTHDPSTGKPFWTTGVAFHPNGQWLAVGANDGYVSVLSVRDGGLVHRLEGHQGLIGIRGIAFSPDGQFLASASVDGTVRLWDALTGKAYATLDHQGAQVLSIAWFPNSSSLASSSTTSGNVLVWNVQSQSLAQALPFYQGDVTTLVYAPDSRMLATGGSTGIIRLYDLESDHQIVLTDGATSADSLAFFRDTILGAATRHIPGNVVLFNMLQRYDTQTFEGLSGSAFSVAISPDETLIAAGSSEGEIAVWNVQQQQLVQMFHSPKHAVLSLAFESTGTYLIAHHEIYTDTIQAASEITIWNMQRGTLHHTMHDHQHKITGLAVHPHKPLFASSSQDGTWYVWNIRAEGVHKHLQATKEQSRFSCITFSPDGSLVVTGSSDGSITFWDTETGKNLSSLSVSGRGIVAIAFRPDGRQLAVSEQNGQVIMFEAKE